MAEVFLDAFIDSLKLFAAVLVITFVIALIEPKLSEKVRLKGSLAPLIGVSVSLIPQCGFSVVATDLYHKRHISLGTLIGVYLATSDEAFFVFISYPQKALDLLPIILCKFILGLIFGYLIDLIFKKNVHSVKHHLEHCEDEYKIRLMECESAELVDKCNHGAKNDCDCEQCAASDCPHPHEHCSPTCCAHESVGKGILYDFKQQSDVKSKKKAKIDRFLIAPTLHSFEIFLYVFVINILFGVILYYIGEEKIVAFLTANKYVAPLFAVIVGAIPNCASSIILSELYIFGGLGFGAILGGLSMNAGVAFIYLFKNTKMTKQNILVFLLMFLISVFVGYIASLACSFAPLDL